MSAPAALKQNGMPCHSPRKGRKRQCRRICAFVGHGVLVKTRAQHPRGGSAAQHTIRKAALFVGRLAYLETLARQTFPPYMRQAREIRSFGWFIRHRFPRRTNKIKQTYLFGCNFLDKCRRNSVASLKFPSRSIFRTAQPTSSGMNPAFSILSRSSLRWQLPPVFF